MTDAIVAAQPGEFRKGWRNLTAATIGIGLGVAAYTPVSSFFFSALEQEYGWSKAAAAGALIAMPITAVMLPIAGWLIDRIGVRLISGLSAALAVLSYVWLSQMGGQVKEFYFAIIALNLLGCATGPVAYTRLVAAQFTANRGLALAIAQFGIAFIGVLMPQCIGWMISSYGWRGGYAFFALATGLGALCAQLLMQPIKKSENVEIQAGATPRRAMASPAFWLLGFAIMSISIAAFGLIAQFQAVLGDRGVGFRAAAGLLSLFAVAVMISRLIVGRLLDGKHPAAASAAVMAISAIGAALLLLPVPGVALIAVAVILLGSSIGGELDLMSFFCARLFGLRYYAAIYGLLSIFFYMGIAIGGISYGVIRTRLGTYDPALAGSAMMLLVSAGLFLLLGRQRPVETPVSA